MQNKISLQDRYRGAMVGVLCGDAIGAPYETWPGVAIRMDVERRGGLFLFDYEDPFEKDGYFPAGKPTDDSEMTAALAEHYVHGEKGGSPDLYDRFRRLVVDKESALCALPAYGFGGTTRKALKEPTYTDSLWELNTSTRNGTAIPSNGALMRTVPVALRYRGATGVPDLSMRAIMAAHITHRHPDAVHAAVIYTHILNGILFGKTYEAAVDHVFAQGAYSSSDCRRALRLPAERPPVPKGFGGGAVHTLHVAHWAVATSSSFEEGITKAVTIGRDVDTYGAVAGGLLGALYGVEAIPAKWKDGLLGGDRMIALADSLYDLSEHG